MRDRRKEVIKVNGGTYEGAFIQVVKYQVKITCINELLRYITTLIMKCGKKNQTMMLLKIRSDLLIFISYSMNVLVNFSVNFAPGNEIFDSFELPIKWAFQKIYDFNFSE